MKRLSIFFAALALCMATSSVQAGSYTIEFNRSYPDSGSSIDAYTSPSSVATEASAQYIQSFTSSCNHAYFNCQYGVKLGFSMLPGTLEFNLASFAQNNITKITVKSAKRDEQATLSLAADGTTLLSSFTPGTEASYTFDTKTKVQTVTLKTSLRRAYISSITFEYEDSPATSITLDKDSLKLEQYKHARLTATMTPADATTAIKWTSSDTTVASVLKGYVTANKPGKAYITADVSTTEGTAVKAGCWVIVSDATPITVAEAVKIASSASQYGVAAEGGKYLIRGFVTEVAEEYDSQTVSVWMADTQDGGNLFEAYQAVPADATDADVAVGDSIEVIGEVTKKSYLVTTIYQTVANSATLSILKKAIFTVTPKANDESMGTVKGAGQYVRKDTATLTATANQGYEFVAWVDANQQDTLGKETTLKLKVTKNTTVYAIFQAEEVLTPATWYGQTPLTGTLSGKDVDYSIVYDITRNADKTLTVNFTINDAAAAVPGFVPQLIITEWKGNFAKDEVTGVYSLTTQDKYKDGVVLDVKIYMAYTGGNTYAQTILYTVGSSNNKPTAVDAVAGGTTVTKRIEDGVLVIEKNGVRYNAQGVVME